LILQGSLRSSGMTEIAGDMARDSAGLERQLQEKIRAAGAAGVPESKLGAKKLRESREWCEALSRLMDSGIVQIFQKGRARGYVHRDHIPTVDSLSAALRAEAGACRAGGIPSPKLSSWKKQSPELLSQALALLVDSGDLVEVRKGKRSIYYGKGHAPDPAAPFREDLEKKMSSGHAWLEKALLGTAAQAPMRRGVLERWVSEGKLIRIAVHTSAVAAVPAYLAGAAGGPCADKPPHESDWADIETVARRQAARSVDRSVAFEEMAEALGSAPAFVQTAVVQQLRNGARIQLVEGEAREFRHPSTAALEWNGTRYFRFRFVD
jgi:hypothetical protein